MFFGRALLGIGGIVEIVGNSMRLLLCLYAFLVAL
jgi:hypothetical protein